ncbi:MAG TPA: hypothetical protein PKD00_00750 [Burkholderiales bacterium]|nr:hypothetical protein [Burkholderiales bacterium]
MISYSVVVQEEEKKIVGAYGISDQKTFNVTFTQELYDTLENLNMRLNGVTTMTDAQEIMIAVNDALSAQPVRNFSDLTYGFVVKSNLTGKHHLAINGVIITQAVLPKAFVLDLEYAHSKGLNLLPMVKFMLLAIKRALRFGNTDISKWLSMQYNYLNKEFVDPIAYKSFIEKGFSEKIAAQKATVRQTPFTSEGLVLMKKVVSPIDDRYKFVYENGEVKAVLRDGITPSVNEFTGELSFEDTRYAEELHFEPVIMRKNGDPFYSGSTLGHIVKVGKVTKLERWDQVNIDPYASCVPGLHVGNQDYIKSFENDSSVTLNVIVSPLDIGTVAINQSEDVMRVRQYFPTSIKGREETNKHFYHPSVYAKQTEADWVDTLEEIINSIQENHKEYSSSLNTKVDVLALMI